MSVTQSTGHLLAQLVGVALILPAKRAALNQTMRKSRRKAPL
jgi:hypothetical protein